MSLINVIAGEKRIDAGVELRTITMVGYMGTGKTTMAKHLVAKAYRELKKRKVKDKEILALHFYRANVKAIIDYVEENYDPSRLQYLYLINDDAVYSNISRRSLSAVNVEDARRYVVIRHELKKMGFDGVLIVFHMTQLYYLLDKVLRDAQVLVFKSVSRDSTERKTLSMLLGRHYYRILKQLTDAIYAGTKEQLKKALSTAVVVVGTQKLIYTFKKEDPPSKIYKEISPSEVEELYSNKVKITYDDLRTIFNILGVRCGNSKLCDVVKAVNYIILRKLLGDYSKEELEDYLYEILENKGVLEDG